MSQRIQELRAEIRATRKEMRERKIRRISCFNGGHSPESYRLNSRMFALETELQRLDRKVLNALLIEGRS